MDVWQIRRSGVPIVESPIPYLGYSMQTMKSMAKCGYYLYCNGKKVKL